MQRGVGDWKRGLPSKQTPKVVEEILSRLSNGETLISICRDERMPSRERWNVWCRQDADLDMRRRHARELGWDAIADAAREELWRKPVVIEGRVDTGDVALRSKRADFDLKLLGKWASGTYADRVDVKHSGDAENPVKVETVVHDAAAFTSRLSSLIARGYASGGTGETDA